jgi:hypothetical protein
MWKGNPKLGMNAELIEKLKLRKNLTDFPELFALSTIYLKQES